MNYKANLIKKINQPLYNELLKDKNEGKLISIYDLTGDQIDILMFDESIGGRGLKELFNFEEYPDDILEKAWEYHDFGKGEKEDVLITLCSTFIKNYRNEKENEGNSDLLINVIQKETNRILEKITELEKEELYEGKEFLRRKMSYEKFTNHLLNRLKEEKIEDGEDFIINEYESALLSGEYSDEKWNVLFRKINAQTIKLNEFKNIANDLLFIVMPMDKKFNMLSNKSYDGIEGNQEIKKIFDNSYSKLENYQEIDLDEVKKKLKMKINKI